MISKDLIDKINDSIILEEPVNYKLAKKLLDNYKKLIESNTELHKELAKLKSERDKKTREIEYLKLELKENQDSFKWWWRIESEEG